MLLQSTHLPGQPERVFHGRNDIWVRRFSRALTAEVERLPAYPPPLPWPVRPLPRELVREHNRELLLPPPDQPPRRKPRKSYVPRTAEVAAARTETYGPEGSEDFFCRVKLSWPEPRLWSIEAVVDPGGRDYLPFFREVIIRLPLKAKICCELRAGREGEWRGACRQAGRLNAREQLTRATRWLLATGQEVPQPVPSSRTRADGPAPAAPGSPLTAHSVTAHSVGAAVYHAKIEARARQMEADRQARLREMAAREWAQRTYWGQPWYRETGDQMMRRQAERERRLDEEFEAIGIILSQGGGVPDLYTRSPHSAGRDDHDGYFVARAEIDPDPYEGRRPAFKRRRSPYGRKLKRALTARERLMRVKPSARIVPTGPRSSELIVTRRLHELQLGLAEAWELAGMIEGAIKRRDPLAPGRKRSWRQQFRDRIVNDHRSVLTYLVRNPLSGLDSSQWTSSTTATGTGTGTGKRKDAESAAGQPGYGSWTGPPAMDPDGATPRAGETETAAGKNPDPSGRGARPLMELFPPGGAAPFYLESIAPQWVTAEGDLFAATPGGEFGTSVVSYRLELPRAVMPPALYERWLARGGCAPGETPNPQAERHPAAEMDPLRKAARPGQTTDLHLFI